VTDEPTRAEVHAAWDANAIFWDEKMREGLILQRELVHPTAERLLALRPGERVLEIACGNGEFSRRLAEAGAQVLATDVSERMLERARAHGGAAVYRPLDATDAGDLERLGVEGPFDAVVCNMALMDIADLEPLASSLPTLLDERGRFVFSVLHPAFCSVDSVRTLEHVEHEDHLERVHSVKVTAYITPRSGKGIAVEGQPASQWYFDRPLSLLLEPFLRHGLALDALEEPVLDPSAASDWVDRLFTEIPPVLLCRLRLPR
jgi:SAM-dependent methyltransferase